VLGPWEWDVSGACFLGPPQVLGGGGAYVDVVGGYDFLVFFVFGSVYSSEEDEIVSYFSECARIWQWAPLLRI
jgi:hypothetical protein